MTNYNKATLATFFQTNDVPTGDDFTNLINSQVNLVETAEQAMAGPLNTTALVTPAVSAATINATSTVSAVTGYITTINTSSISVVGVVSAAGLNVTGTVSAVSLNVTGDVLAAAGRVTASAASFNSGVIQGVGIVSAAGTTQAAGAQLVNIINRGQGVADGSTTGFAIIANRTGLVQYLTVETNTSANLWPPTGGTINNTAANTVFALAGRTTYTIIHIGASAYGVK